MANKQTAVEWIYDQLIDNETGKLTSKNKYEIYLKAKFMEKEQLKDAYKTAYNYYQSAEEFYNETYNATQLPS